MMDDATEKLLARESQRFVSKEIFEEVRRSNEKEFAASEKAVSVALVTVGKSEDKIALQHKELAEKVSKIENQRNPNSQWLIGLLVLIIGILAGVIIKGLK